MPGVLGVNSLADDVDVEVGSLEEGEDLSREELSEGLTLKKGNRRREGRRTRQVRDGLVVEEGGGRDERTSFWFLIFSIRS